MWRDLRVGTPYATRCQRVVLTLRAGRLGPAAVRPRGLATPRPGAEVARTPPRTGSPRAAPVRRPQGRPLPPAPLPRREDPRRRGSHWGRSRAALRARPGRGAPSPARHAGRGTPPAPATSAPRDPRSADVA